MLFVAKNVSKRYPISLLFVDKCIQSYCLKNDCFSYLLGKKRAGAPLHNNIEVNPCSFCGQKYVEKISHFFAVCRQMHPIVLCKKWPMFFECFGQKKEQGLHFIIILKRMTALFVAKNVLKRYPISLRSVNKCIQSYCVKNDLWFSYVLGKKKKQGLHFIIILKWIHALLWPKIKKWLFFVCFGQKKSRGSTS